MHRWTLVDAPTRELLQRPICKFANFRFYRVDLFSLYLLVLMSIILHSDGLLGKIAGTVYGEEVNLSVRTHQTALTLMARYILSVYDANIVAAEALSGCAVLYSEDMQDGRNVQLPGSASANALVIKNPFRGWHFKASALTS